MDIGCVGSGGSGTDIRERKFVFLFACVLAFCMYLFDLCTYLFVDLFVCGLVYVCVCFFCASNYLFACDCLYMCVHACLLVCVLVCVFVYVYFELVIVCACKSIHSFKRAYLSFYVIAGV